MSIKAAIFDLDSTLIDTSRIKDEIINFIIATFGVGKDDVWRIYNRSRSRDGKVIFSLETIKEELANTLEDLDDNLWNNFFSDFIKEDESFLINGAVDLLNYLKNNNINIYILTLGVESWQYDKIKKSGLSKILGNNLDCVRLTIEEDLNKGKINSIRDILIEADIDSSEAVFFNDKPDETLGIINQYPDLKVFVRRERRDDRYTDGDFTELKKCGSVIKISDDLNIIDDIKNII